MKNKILFISHDASLSGAPLVLFNFIKWSKKTHGITPLLLLLEGGALEKEFESVGITWNLAAFHTNATFKEKLVARFNSKKRKELYKKRIFNEIEKHFPEICYANTIVTSKIANEIKQRLRLPVLMHVHEMSFSANTYYSNLISPNIFCSFDRFVAVSEGVKYFLLNELKIKESFIKVVHPFIINKTSKIEEEKNSAKLTIGFSGFGNWQKGFYTLPFLMRAINERCKNNSFSFLWMGNIPPQQKNETLYVLDKLNISDQLVITGYTKDTNVYFQKMDIFVILSMEDSFPLVCIEAGSFKLPIVCFKGSGGANDFVKPGGGISVPFLDIDQMADEIIRLKNDNQLRIQLGDSAFQSAALHDIEIIAPQLWNELISLLD